MHLQWHSQRPTYGQTVGVSVFFQKTEWFCMVLRILNQEEQLNCMIGSKVTTILPTFFSKNSETSIVGMWGVYPEAIDSNIALHTQIFFGIFDLKSQKY